MKKNREKKKTPTEIIESTSRPYLEAAFVKPRRGEFWRRLIQWRRPKAVRSLYRLDSPDFDIHTHVYIEGKKWNGIPSPRDFKDFLGNDSKMSAVAQRDSITGKVMGYTFLRKTREYEEPTSRNLFGELRTIKSEKSEKSLESYMGRVKSENIQMRFVPAPGYKFNKETGNYVPKEKSLERTVATALIASFILAAVFLNQNLTGFIISNSVQNYSLITILLLVIAIFLIYLLFNYAKKRKMIKLIENRLNKKRK